MNRECQLQKGARPPAPATDPICTDGVERLRLRGHGRGGLPTLVYLPGIHGDWTLIGPFRHLLGGRFRFIEMTYPRTPCWSLEDYGREIDQALEAEGIREAWLLGESFGSQVMWELARRSEGRWRGLILAGGFVRYPAPRLLKLARAVCPRVSHRLLHRLLPAYFYYSRLRHARIPGALDAARDFIARRTPEDQAAAVWRLSLIAGNDPRPIAATTRLPVHHLYGALDPIVPWPPVAQWLRRHCATLRASRCVPYSDHTVLVSAASDSVAEVCRWTA